MKKFEDRSDGGMYITENQAQIHLAPHEAYALWRWLSARKDTFQAHSSANQLKIHLYQGNLSHLDDLKTAIPDQHEREPIVKALEPEWETATERALQLLKEFQVQYHVHPLLEDDSTYAQG
jgi:hypothetical protein